MAERQEKGPPANRCGTGREMTLQVVAGVVPSGLYRPFHHPHEDDDTLRPVYYLRGIQAHGNVGVHAFVAPDAPFISRFATHDLLSAYTRRASYPG